MREARLAAGALALALASPAIPADARQDPAALLATWKDGEIRESFDTAARVSQIAVAVMPSGPHGSLTLVLSARWPGRANPDPAGRCHDPGRQRNGARA